MKRLILIVLFFNEVFSYGFDSSNDLLTSKVKFASIDKAKELLTTEDEFTNSWSQFDIDSRLHKDNGTKQQLLEFISYQTKEWTIDEKINMTKILIAVGKNIMKNGFKINLPSEIYFIKTTGLEEGGAVGYTRANYIVLKDNILSQPTKVIQTTIVHELFHILSRNDSTFRKKMYKIVGFESMNKISYPDSIKDFRITNPDAPQTDSYIHLKKDGKPIDCMMILFSNNNFSGGDFFNYLKVGFLLLKGTDTKEIDYNNGKITIYTFSQVSNFMEQVGYNTKYIIHPEEILADNFVFAVKNKKNLPSQWIIDKINNELK
jgi:hypothetical protein